LFEDFNGYYAVFSDGVEFARFAPSPMWEDFAKSIRFDNSITYKFVSTEKEH
jgi:hypothetical protein